MKIKNKGKVYPSPSPSPSSSSSSSVDVLSVLQLLPAAILALVSMLSLEDREVLAYMITRSIKTSSSSSSFSSVPATTCSSMAVQDCSKKRSKRASSKASNSISNHKPPVFDCDCFDCYRSYWLRWNSSSHGELMDQAIEAFEENLTNGENNNNTNNHHQRNSGRGKRRDKISRREAVKAAAAASAAATDVEVQTSVAEPETAGENGDAVVLPVDSPDGESGKEEVAAEAMGVEVELTKADGEEEEEEGDEDSAVFVRTATANNHKGLARKVLPDVLGLFNSRLWSLWGPNV